VILIDTSSWIHMLRPNGDAKVRVRVERALATGEACWFAMVRLELWNGAGGERERKVLRDFERLLPDLVLSADVWNAAADLARRARTKAVTVPASDLLIAACARHYGAALDSADSDFDLLAAID
jgi:predicted nucleic acid-binding protein